MLMLVINDNNMSGYVHSAYIRGVKSSIFATSDHISSAPAVVFPVKGLVDLCHQYDVWALIDGAHAPGHLHLNLEELGADFYIG